MTQIFKEIIASIPTVTDFFSPEIKKYLPSVVKYLFLKNAF